MRVTHNTLSRNLLVNLNDVSNKMQKMQTKISSGKRIEKPSDDPVGITQSMNFKTNITELEQYSANISEALYWLKSTSSVLSNTEDVLFEINDLGNRGGSDLMTEGQRGVLADQIDQYLEDLVDLANSNVSGKYILGGTQTLTAPFSAVKNAGGTITSVTPNPEGINGEIERVIGKNQTMVVNSKGDELFQPVGKDIFAQVIQLRDALREPQATFEASEVETCLDNLNTSLERVINENSNTGTKICRLDFIDHRLGLEILQDTEKLSDLQDTDYAEILIKYQAQENIYQIALNMGARLIQNTLLNYI
ncbi:MAG: flagellar hook-associated protein 3 [Candidatus Omnitrophota bacterium]|nr:MAG: flagellar hook-associated protein 3 [Candidatus Omnitrophota bacterium]